MGREVPNEGRGSNGQRDVPAVSGRGGDGGEAAGSLAGSGDENEPRGAFHPDA